MDARVKEFIEKNIRPIEEENWEKVFKSALLDMEAHQSPNFIDLFLYILDEAGVNYHDIFESINLSKESFQEVLNKIFDQSWDILSPYSVIRESRLKNGFNLKGIALLALNLGLTPYKLKSKDDVLVIVNSGLKIQDIIEDMSYEVSDFEEITRNSLR